MPRATAADRPRLPLGFGRCERNHRALDSEQVALAISCRAQRPADMRGERRVEQRMPKTPDRIAIGVDRLHEDRIGVVSIGGSTE